MIQSLDKFLDYYKFEIVIDPNSKIEDIGIRESIEFDHGKLSESIIFRESKKEIETNEILGILS